MSNCQTQEKVAALSQREKALKVNKGLGGTDLHRGMVDGPAGQNTPFRISPEPFWIDEELYREIEALGPHLLRFYEGANRLYLHAVRGRVPSWVKDYLERGKSETVLDYQKMRRFRIDLPIIIRPDILPTDQGLVLSELDSVPGGFGLLAALSEQYSRLGYDLVGGELGIPQGFYDALKATVSDDVENPFVALVVSDESEDYRGEMEWISQKVRELGGRIRTLHPRDLEFDEEGLYAPAASNEREKIDVLYRFFELFDLKNIPKIDLILYAIRKEMVRATPPIKSHLEEKLLFALAHHGSLKDFWRQQLGKETFEVCRSVFPQTWVVDPTPVPPHAVIPGLTIGGRPVSDWTQLKDASQKERELVLKPSGFSPFAWGSRGVIIGHDVPAEEWSKGIDDALEAFQTTPYILQEFHKGSRFRVSYYDFDEDRIKQMNARVRLCPYYFVVDGTPRLAGILATAVSLEKKAIHGMSEAVMAPVAVRPSAN